VQSPADCSFYDRYIERNAGMFGQCSCRIAGSAFLCDTDLPPSQMQYRSALNPLLSRINAYLMRWIRNKYKRLRPTTKATAVG
jgi:hypothetical protein